VNITEKWLVWRFNRGDAEAVQVIYDKHKEDLLALALALLKDRAAAEDVVHDVFAAFVRRKKFQLTGSLRGYLATCVANRARNALRDNRRHHYEPLDDDGERCLPSSGPWPDDATMLLEENRLLADALGELPYEQREVVLLHIHGGLKFVEIAQSQNVSINTVLGRYRYGLEKLRSKLNDEVFHAT